MNLYPTFPAPQLLDQQRQSIAIPRYGMGWNFNFETGEFILDGRGNPQKLDDWNTWRLWCMKALLTIRNAYLAYSGNYGSELDRLVGTSFNRAAIETEIRRMVIDALKVNPRVQRVEKFQFQWDGKVVSVTFRVWPTVGQPIDLGASVNA